MKRIFVLFLSIVCLATLLCGCSGQTKPSLTPESKGNDSVSGDITVYIGNYYVYDYDSATKAFQDAFPNVKLNLLLFDTPEKYIKRVEQDMENDTLPDLIVTINAQDPYDLGQLAVKGRLLDLLPLLEQDQGFHPEEYYTETFASGQFGGKQYILPVSFSLDVVCSREQYYKDTGLQLEEGYTTADLFNGIVNFCDRFDANSEEYLYPYPMLSLPSTAYYIDVLQMAGLELFDPETRTLSFPDNEVPPDLMDFCAEYFYRQTDFFSSQVIGYHPTGESSLMNYVSENAALFTLPVWMDPMRLFSIETLSQMKGQALKVIPVPQYDDPTKYAAQVEVCGGIAANSKNPEAAYALLRTLQDTELKAPYGFSVRRANNDTALQKARDKKMQYADTLAYMLENLGRAQLAPSLSLYAALGERMEGIGKDVSQEELFEATYRALEYYLTDPPYNTNALVRWY